MYLITFPTKGPKEEPFLTEWFDIENNYVEGMVVYDLKNCMYYKGEKWIDIEHDEYKA